MFAMLRDLFLFFFYTALSILNTNNSCYTLAREILGGYSPVRDVAVRSPTYE